MSEKKTCMPPAPHTMLSTVGSSAASWAAGTAEALYPHHTGPAGGGEALHPHHAGPAGGAEALYPHHTVPAPAPTPHT